MRNFTVNIDSAIVLRLHHLKATPIRILILNEFKKEFEKSEYPDFMLSARMITERISHNEKKTHLASMYRTLKTFEKNGLIRKVWFEIKDSNNRRNKEIFYELK